MNDLGSLATQIVNYSFDEDTGRFPVTYISGWLDANIGLLNAYTHEEFSVDETGAFAPSGLLPIEEAIYTTLYTIAYYDKAAREALRGVIYGGDAAGAVSMIKEGDTTIQKTSKAQMSRTFAEFAKDARMELDDLIYQYNSDRAGVRQVAGEDGYTGEVDNGTEYNYRQY